MHTTLPPELPEPAPVARPFQFGVRHLLAVMAAVCLAGAGYQWIGSGVLCLLIPLSIVAFVMFAARQHAVEILVVLTIIGLLAGGLLPAMVPPGPRRFSARSPCRNNLRQIALALHNYHDVYKSFPPAYVADENGRPMHSWRVLILPFLEQKPLYDQYRFDEPWDGPNNRKLAAELKAYLCPAQRGLAAQTSYVAVVGPGTAWPGVQCVRLDDIADGPGNTILIVEVHNSGIPWMEPRDLDASQMAPAINAKGAGRSISSGHPGMAQAALADGSVRTLPDDTPPATVRALLTIAGGEQVEAP